MSIDQHEKPAASMTCLCTMEDITEEDGNYVEYQCYPSMKWKPAHFELSVVQQLLDSQFETYLNRVKKTDCQSELRRLLATGPPIYLSDKHGLPLDEGEEYVINLWYACDGKERSAKLKGALEGVERDELLQSLNRFVIVEGKESIDDEESDDTTTT